MAKQPLPVLANVQKVNQPISGNKVQYKRPKTDYPTHIKWSFSFKYFNQIQFFSLDRSDPKWFVSLLERLSLLSKDEISMIFQNPTYAQSHRFHRIDWSSKNIPIKREDLNWIDKDYISNDEEFPFYQLQISKALGRIVGFWDENNTIFHIVLLDPLHNIQPSQNYDYKVDDCYPLSCVHTSLLKDIEDLKKSKCCTGDCDLNIRLQNIPSRQVQTNAVIAFLDDDFLVALNEILKTKTFTEILETAILKTME